MELQLCLALPTNAVIEFDPNSYVYEPKNSTLGLDFGFCSEAKKRGFDEAFVRAEVPPTTLPLLHWTDQPNDEDDPKDLHNNNSSVSFNKLSEEDGVVGWPPIKNLTKKKHRHQNHHGGRATKNNYQTLEYHNGRQSNSMLVKVKMEGVAITRKIDLSLHDSFQTLTNTLISMFGFYSNDYKLTYQDTEGDWLLAQDVPWRNFIRTVQRLRLLKSKD